MPQRKKKENARAVTMVTPYQPRVYCPRNSQYCELFETLMKFYGFSYHVCTCVNATLILLLFFFLLFFVLVVLTEGSGEFAIWRIACIHTVFAYICGHRLFTAGQIRELFRIVFFFRSFLRIRLGNIMWPIIIELYRRQKV